MKRLRGMKWWQFVKAHWRLLGIIGIAVIALGLLLLYRLGSLTSGLSDGEVSQQLFSSSWHTIAHNPLNAPLTVVQWLLLTIFTHHGQTIARFPSILFGIMTLAAFSYVLKRWYGVRTALYGTILFGFSSWFLHISRLGTTDVLYLWALPTLLAVQLAWQRHSQKLIINIIAVIALAIMLYIPGLLWPILAGLCLQPHQLITAWKGLKQWWARVAIIILFAVLVAPLVIALSRTPALIQTWLGLPHTFGNANSMVKRLMESVSFFVVRGPLLPTMWLDTVPILDNFVIFMTVLGALFYAKHITLPRTRLIIGLFLVSAVFFALNGPVSLSLLVPLIYFIAAAGIGYLLHDWLRVFPRNPLARTVGFGLVSMAVALSCSYNVRAYFIAWPHNRTTTITFHNHR